MSDSFVAGAAVQTEHSEVNVPQAVGSVPIFLRNTHDMISFCDRSRPSVAAWDTDGKNIVIKDVKSLATEIFPAYFKHTNFLSFARQLNFYGFRKVKVKSKLYCIYHHEFFLRNRTDMLSLIRRQPSDASNDSQIIASIIPPAPPNTDELENVKKKVDTLTATVASLHKEVADLKSVVSSLVDVIQSNSSIIYELQASRKAVSTSSSNGVRYRYYETGNHAEESRKPVAFTEATSNFPALHSADPMHENQVLRIPEDSNSYFHGVAQGQGTDDHNRKRPKLIHEVSFSYGSSGTESCHAPTMSIHNNVHEDCFPHQDPHWKAPASDVRLDHHWTSTPPESNVETRQSLQDQWNPSETRVETRQSHQDHSWGTPAPDISTAILPRHQDDWDLTHATTESGHPHQGQWRTSPAADSRVETNEPHQDVWGTPPAETRVDTGKDAKRSQIDGSSVATAPARECSVDLDFCYEDMAWFTLFEEDASHSADDQIFAPQA